MKFPLFKAYCFTSIKALLKRFSESGISEADLNVLLKSHVEQSLWTLDLKNDEPPIMPRTKFRPMSEDEMIEQAREELELEREISALRYERW